jgi:glycosyltransferase involved in cell wall biosynthesis
MFSIIIPSWNNLDYLKLCIASIRAYSAYDHEILVHVNDGSDGTLEWVRVQSLKHSHASDNVGVCIATNYLAAQATRDWLLYLNDDMVCCPGWDVALADAIRATPTNLAMFFSSLIEPIDTGNRLVTVQNFGRTPTDFDETRMLANYLTGAGPDIEGHGSQPTLVHRMWWQIVGGYSVEFGPGMSSDDDLLMKFWVIGCREFRIVGASRVYHFSMSSTDRVRKNRGGRTFVMKWGITQSEFKQKFLSQSRHAGSPEMTAIRFPHGTCRGSLKRIGYAFGDYPLGDLAAWAPVPGPRITTIK